MMLMAAALTKLVLLMCESSIIIKLCESGVRSWEREAGNQKLEARSEKLASGIALQDYVTDGRVAS